MGETQVIRSIFDCEFLKSLIERNWKVTVEQLIFLHLGFNDSYLVRTDKGKFIARLYKQGWRSDSEILSELKILAALQKKKLPVASFVRTGDGDMFITVDAPEGERPLVLFDFIDGEIPHPLTKEDAKKHGELLQELHSFLKKAGKDLDRPKLGVSFLVDEPIQTLNESFPDKLDEIEELSNNLKTLVSKVNFKGKTHLIHGDFLSSNLISNKKNHSIIDFDFCGAGLPEYDLATYLWGVYKELPEKEAKACEKSFLQGYGIEVNKELTSKIAILKVLREFWVWAINVKIGYDFRRLASLSFDFNVGQIKENLKKCK